MHEAAVDKHVADPWQCSETHGVPGWAVLLAHSAQTVHWLKPKTAETEEFTVGILPRRNRNGY